MKFREWPNSRNFLDAKISDIKVKSLKAIIPYHFTVFDIMNCTKRWPVCFCWMNRLHGSLRRSIHFCQFDVWFESSGQSLFLQCAPIYRTCTKSKPTWEPAKEIPPITKILNKTNSFSNRWCKSCTDDSSKTLFMFTKRINR